jgi:hypothetical protein
VIREDVENTVETSDGRFYIVPSNLMLKLVGIDKNDVEKEIKFVRKLLNKGGDIIDVETGNYPREVNIVKKWMVDKEGNNEAVIELRAKKTKAHRFLTKNELTFVEYASKRVEELEVTPDQIAHKTVEFLNEYIKLTES